MLAELRIRNLAVIEAASLEFGGGLNVLTGETGAGKSIIVDALAVALGARASADLIRTGAASARVEARFLVRAGGPAARWLHDQGMLDAAEMDTSPGASAPTAPFEVVVSRDVTPEGRSRAWINGRPATAGMLRELGEVLVEVIGQHEGQRLLRPQVHLDLLDAFGGSDVARLRARVASLVDRRRALRAEHRTLVEGERERLRQAEMLRHQVAEIDAARPQPDEEEALQARRTRLANAERLAGAAAAAYAALYEADGQAAVDRLGQARGILREAAALDPALAGAAEDVEALAGETAEVAHGLAAYLHGIEARPDELEAVEERLALLRSLRRKYGETLAAVLAYRDEAAAALARLEGSVERTAEVAAMLEQVEGDLAEDCRRLSQARRHAATRLEAAVERTLEALEMKRTRLAVAFALEPDPDGLAVGGDRVAVGPAGIDRVEFLLAPNPGEAPRPLSRIASGGELSRVMLALRHALAEAGGPPVLVCDEVDAGVGSRAAGAVGALLAAVSRTRQVLCVTHLPQIASMADHHFWVVKETGGERTRVGVRPLEGDERVEEVARMLGGRRPTSIAREHAAELLARAGHGRPGAGRQEARRQEAGAKTSRGGRR